MYGLNIFQVWTVRWTWTRIPLSEHKQLDTGQRVAASCLSLFSHQSCLRILFGRKEFFRDSRVNIVGIVTWVWDGRPWDWASIPSRGRRLADLPNAETGCGFCAAYYSLTTDSFFCDSKEEGTCSSPLTWSTAGPALGYSCNRYSYMLSWRAETRLSFTNIVDTSKLVMQPLNILTSSVDLL